MKATLQRGVYGEEKQTLEIEGDAMLSIFQKCKPVSDSEHRYLLCWTNAEYREANRNMPTEGLVSRESTLLAPKALVVSIYLTAAEYRQMRARIDVEGEQKEER